MYETISHVQQSTPRPNKNCTKQYHHQGSFGRELKTLPKTCTSWTSPRNKPWGTHPPQRLSDHPIAVSLRALHRIEWLSSCKGLILDASCPTCGSGDPTPYPTSSPAPRIQRSSLLGICVNELSLQHAFYTTSVWNVFLMYSLEEHWIWRWIKFHSVSCCL